MTHRTRGSEFANVPLLFPLMTSDEIIIAGAVLELRPYRAGRNENCGTPDASSQLTCLERRPTRYEQSVFPWPNRAVGWLSRVPSNPAPAQAIRLARPLTGHPSAKNSYAQDHLVLARGAVNVRRRFLVPGTYIQRSARPVQDQTVGHIFTLHVDRWVLILSGKSWLRSITKVDSEPRSPDLSKRIDLDLGIDTSYRALPPQIRHFTFRFGPIVARVVFGR